MPNDPTPATATPETTSNQALAQQLLAQGLPTESTDVLQLYLQFLANEVVKRLAQGESLEDCSALMDRYVRYDSLRLRGLALKLREARQSTAAAEAAEPAALATAAEAEPSAPSRIVTSSPPKPAHRTAHLSRQQRRALLRRLTQAVVLADGITNAS